LVALPVCPAALAREDSMKRTGSILLLLLVLLSLFPAPSSASRLALPTPIPPKSIEVSIANVCIQMGAGENRNVIAKVLPSNTSSMQVTFTSSNSAVVALNNIRCEKDTTVITLYAKAKGKATITAKTSNGKTSSFQVDVYDTPWSLSPMFVKDARWKSGIAWGAGQRPKLNPRKTTSGCAAYAADYVYYVFKKSSYADGRKFYKVSDIRKYDVIHTTNHYFVVLSRSGNELHTAEGNASGKVTVSKTKYFIQNGVLKVRYGTKVETRKMVYGFHMK